MKEPYTVYAIFDDSTQRYTAFVDATSPEDAEKKAIKGASAPIIIAGVVKGYISPVDGAARSDITPIHGRGYDTWVSRLVTTNERFKIPFHCPKCRCDLRKPNAIWQTDYPARVWDSRIPRGEYPADHWGAVINEDRGAETSGKHQHVLAVVLRCAACQATLWDGYRNDGPDRTAPKKTRRS